MKLVKNLTNRLNLHHIPRMRKHDFVQKVNT